MEPFVYVSGTEVSYKPDPIANDSSIIFYCCFGVEKQNYDPATILLYGMMGHAVSLRKPDKIESQRTHRQTAGSSPVTM